MNELPVRFPGATGESLAARLVLPPGRVQGFALFAHCFTCGKDLRAARVLTACLARRGFGVLRFDFTGIGESEGDFADTNFSSNVEDLVAAADWLREHHHAPSLLVGHSLGGTAVLVGAGSIPEAKAVATIGAPCRPDHVRKLIDQMAPDLDATGESEVNLAGRSFRIRRQFLEDLSRPKMKEILGNLNRALLVCHAPLDNIVGIDNAADIFQGAMHPKSFISLDDADHLLRRREDAEYAGEVIAAWASRYVEPPPDTTEVEGDVQVQTGRGFATTIRARDHLLVADEPRDVGGTDTGPTPYEYLLAGLGACTGMTLRMYADRKKWDLNSVTVSLRYRRIHARDCAECEAAEGRVEHVDRRIAVSGNLDEAQRQRLLEIADRCPVHRTMRSEVHLTTGMVVATAQ